jgi:glycosyltransferase involved in cell wall biosynthesis
MSPYFSVVIPTYNRLDMLVRVLDALDRQVDINGSQIDAPPYEVIVINDGSKDDTERVMSQRKGIISARRRTPVRDARAITASRSRRASSSSSSATTPYRSRVFSRSTRA